MFFLEERRSKEVNELEENKVSLIMRGFKEHLFFLEESVAYCLLAAQD